MANQLIHETSPYLLQHAHNPVNWYPWSPEALEKARSENKPIFLSIGYAACHWCHVMEHESFEDPATANLLNQYFIAIKVDREERPDLDQLYMEAVVAMTGQGGWPMSVFLTPEGKPFFGGTYFPPTRRHGLPAFREVLTGVARAWSEDPAELHKAGHQLVQHMQASANWKSSREFVVTEQYLETVTDQLLSRYDWNLGGWGGAPKFPAPMTVEFLLRQATRGAADAQRAAVHALNAMRKGGMYDLVGGGFHRYSVDDTWLVPHFEKMLYDNAQLARVYLHASVLTGDAAFRQTCEDTLDFLIREMRHPLGGFFSSLDADSEGEEGRFYVWSEEELGAVLPADQKELLTKTHIWPAGGNFDGHIVLQKSGTDQEIADSLNLDPETLRKQLSAIYTRLKIERDTRVHPATDDKVLVFWNALTLIAFAEAARYLNREDYLIIAQENARFLLDNMLKDRLYRSWRDGQLRNPAVLEDHAALILGLLALYQTDHDQHWFESALSILQLVNNQFVDPEGGFHDTAQDQTDLVIRPKDLQDNATPSGNAMMAEALLIMAELTGEDGYRLAGERQFGVLEEVARKHPTAFSQWLHAMDFSAGPVQQVALVWNQSEKPVDWIRSLWSKFRPRVVLAASPVPLQEQAPALLHNRPVIQDGVTAYICQGFSCKLPTTRLEEFAPALDEASTL